MLARATYTFDRKAASQAGIQLVPQMGQGSGPNPPQPAQRIVGAQRRVADRLLATTITDRVDGGAGHPVPPAIRCRPIGSMIAARGRIGDDPAVQFQTRAASSRVRSPRRCPQPSIWPAAMTISRSA
ncbi:hypothetical protein PE067_00280 [Paracoccus sp. DMF-8]|uniref:hypothetical protein n=1 Tax=Paracoccus sp. DMF-8 TaxID=3019445 RepID=UPI0023E82BC7|nr:hypothetical protein [Paracoccus sp. DMF-8]MDF3604726.1 hypothetical protein [Paracoccus sp. DMF-8]